MVDGRVVEGGAQARAAVYGLSRRLGDVEFLNAHFEGHRFSPHSHPVFAVGAVRSGACRIWHGGVSAVARRGDLVLMDPDAPHSAASAGAADWRYCAVYFSVTTARNWVGRLPRRPGFSSVVGHAPELSTELERLCSVLARDPDDAGADEAFAGLVRRLFKQFGRAVASDAGRGDDDSAAWRARRYLDAHFAGAVRIEELAELTGRSPFTLIRTFSRAFGMPPYTYLTHVRVSRAQEMLRAGRGISDTAYSVGFSDQSHLTRFFRRVVGVPPGVWVRGVGGGVRQPPSTNQPNPRCPTA